MYSPPGPPMGKCTGVSYFSPNETVLARISIISFLIGKLKPHEVPIKMPEKYPVTSTGESRVVNKWR